MIAQRFPISLQLASAAMVFALLISIPTGILSAIRRNSWVDYLLTGISIGGAFRAELCPGFALDLRLLGQARLVPDRSIGTSSGDGTLWGRLVHSSCPPWRSVLTRWQILSRLLRSSMLDVLNQDYIRTANAKGLAFWSVIVGHAVRNALIPIVTVIAIQFGYLIGITITIEFIFAIPGAIGAARSGDHARLSSDPGIHPLHGDLLRAGQSRR